MSPRGNLGVLGGQKLKNVGNVPNGLTDWHQIWHTYADSSGSEHRLKKDYPLETPGGILRGLCGQKLKPGKCGRTAGLIAGCCVSVPVSHTINNFMVSSWVNWVRMPVVAGFVVLCGANIVGNIISAEKRCNYPGRSRVTRLYTVYVCIHIECYAARAIHSVCMYTYRMLCSMGA